MGEWGESLKDCSMKTFYLLDYALLYPQTGERFRTLASCFASHFRLNLYRSAARQRQFLFFTKKNCRGDFFAL